LKVSKRDGHCKRRTVVLRN